MVDNSLWSSSGERDMIDSMVRLPHGFPMSNTNRANHKGFLSPNHMGFLLVVGPSQ